MGTVEHLPVPVHPRRLIVLLAVIAATLVFLTIGGWRSAHAIGTPPGMDVSHDQTPCAVHGGFAALGTFGSSPLHDIGVNYPGSNLRPGATSWMFPNLKSGSTTGGNNNSICGGGNIPTPFDGP
jgi:hypothetical protein